ncbi:hypothetical protein Syun_028416 [Stephania yunnanensis]|uniref:alpha,alpha-trehalose-phosphate synthase (UDP-forming) n=1 Tax=Stephania yunnanensis TaxID=152371 RepID=A0AAP0EHB4_9MAGN
MAGNSNHHSNGYSSISSNRVERLLRERRRRFDRALQLTDHHHHHRHHDHDHHDEEFLESVLNEVKESKEGRARAYRQRLLVVANRLPVSAVRKAEDCWQLEISAGGLVSALLGVKEFEAKWIGWAGVNVPDEIGQRSLTKALDEKRCIPVFLDEEIVHQYYNGYCNNILWPLFHYIGLPQEDRLATTRSFQSQFDAYKKANQMFADVVNSHYEEGDVVWCHDYHLMYLPECLKKYNSKMKVGWFLHTPFPSSEIHRTLPSRSELLRSVLAADLVGACTRILGLEGTPEGVEDQGKLTRVAAFPIGIDADRFIRALELPKVQELIKELKERFDGRKVMLGVDRLDMIKGIPQKILAFEKFLEENQIGMIKWSWYKLPSQQGQTFLSVCSSINDQKLTSQVHEIVGRINGRFGTLTTVPIHHLDRSLDFPALCALYAVTDVALVTSLRDGMNLVSYEFVACQASKKGVLILSEFAGAAQSLGAGAILVNPWNITEVASSIGQALNMPTVERVKRHQHNFMHVTTHTAQDWAETFVSELNDTVVEAQLRMRQVPPPLPIEDAVERYLESRNRLLILGFNGTITEPVETPGRRGGDQIKEMDLKLHPDLKEPLKLLCNDRRTTVVVVSGSNRNVLDDNFGEYNIWLAAENGMFLRPAKGPWMTTMPEHLNMDWVESVKTVGFLSLSKCHFNLTVVDIEFGRLQARDLLQHLWTGPISNAAVDVVQGSRSVEVRSVGVTKGAAVDRILGEIVHSRNIITPIDYVLCLGHFLGKDEDIFSFFDPELADESLATSRAMVTDMAQTTHTESCFLPKMVPAQNGSKTTHSSSQKASTSLDRRNSNNNGWDMWQSQQENVTWHEGSSVLDLNGENYFSCAVGRKRSNARYLLGSSDEVVSFLNQLAAASTSSKKEIPPLHQL